MVCSVCITILFCLLSTGSLQAVNGANNIKPPQQTLRGPIPAIGDQHKSLFSIQNIPSNYFGPQRKLNRKPCTRRYLHYPSDEQWIPSFSAKIMKPMVQLDNLRPLQDGNNTANQQPLGVQSNMLKLPYKAAYDYKPNSYKSRISLSLDDLDDSADSENAGSKIKKDETNNEAPKQSKNEAENDEGVPVENLILYDNEEFNQEKAAENTKDKTMPSDETIEKNKIADEDMTDMENEQVLLTEDDLVEERSGTEDTAIANSTYAMYDAKSSIEKTESSEDCDNDVNEDNKFNNTKKENNSNPESKVYEELIDKFDEVPIKIPDECLRLIKPSILIKNVLDASRRSNNYASDRNTFRTEIGIPVIKDPDNKLNNNLSQNNYDLNEPSNKNFEHINRKGNVYTPNKNVANLKKINQVNSQYPEHNKQQSDDIVNKLLDPTKGAGIVDLSESQVSLMNHGRVCYACSTASNPTCWMPDRKTTVKYCQRGHDVCITKSFGSGSVKTIIRDCGSSCLDSDAPNVFPYKKCSVCHSDLCNSAFSINKHNLLLAFFLLLSLNLYPNVISL